jgi:hypothetical protein
MQPTHRAWTRIVVIVAAGIAAGEPAWAQTSLADRVTFDVVGGLNTSSSTPSRPLMVFDATATVRITNSLDVVMRPWLMHPPGGTWQKEMYQLQIRYQPPTPVPVRIDAGILASPLGIIPLEMRPDTNPLLASPQYYFVPLPSFDGRFDGVQLLSGNYPIGVMASVSGTKWDARAGVTDGTPTRNRRLMANRPPAQAQFITGGGVSPITGLRLGAGFAHGGYRQQISGSPLATSRAADATTFNLEGEYSVGYTRVAGEWIVDRFETATTPAVVRGFAIEAVRTLTPRWYGAARTTRVSTPGIAASGPVRRTGKSADAALGFRVRRDITLKGGYQGSRVYMRSTWDHAVVVSVVYGTRVF